MSSEQQLVPVVEEPNWEPLEKILPRRECTDYMYMGRAGEIELYKHRLTRRYLNISTDGKFYLYSDRRYVEVAQSTALEHVRS